MNTTFTIDDLNDFPPATKQIFKEYLSSIRFTKDAKSSILTLMKCVYKNEVTEMLLANVIGRCLELNRTNEAVIINNNSITNIINEENRKLSSPANY